MKKVITRAGMLICVLMLSAMLVIPVSAANLPEGDASVQASDYISSYGAWASRSTNNKVYVYYDIEGTGYMARIGAKLIVVQMLDAGSWTNVKICTGSLSNGMLLSNAAGHAGNIVYQGTAGNTYRAVVTVYAGPVSGGDSRIITTNTV